MSEEVIKVLDKIIDKWTEKIGRSGEPNYNKDLDYMCCDLLDFRDELKKYVIIKIDFNYENY